MKNPLNPTEDYTFNRPIVSVMGVESGSGEGLVVRRVSSASIVTTSATIKTGITVVSGAWVVFKSAPSATKPTFYKVSYSGATVYATFYNLSGGAPAASGTVDIFAKGNF